MDGPGISCRFRRCANFPHLVLISKALRPSVEPKGFRSGNLSRDCLADGAPPKAGNHNNTYSPHFDDPIPPESEDCLSYKAINVMERGSANEDVTNHQSGTDEREHSWNR